MSLRPGYGETVLSGDEVEFLVPVLRAQLGEPVGKADIYALEVTYTEELAEHHLNLILDEGLSLDDVLSDHFLRQLHRDMYADIWIWGGLLRSRETNIGVAPERIAPELRESLETIRYRWSHTEDWTARELGIAVHAEAVRIHPFADGNGRATRLLADLVFTAAQTAGVLEQYDWDIEKDQYIQLLREFDVRRDPRELAAFVPVRTVTG